MKLNIHWRNRPKRHQDVLICGSNDAGCLSLDKWSITALRGCCVIVGTSLSRSAECSALGPCKRWLIIIDTCNKWLLCFSLLYNMVNNIQGGQTQFSSNLVFPWPDPMLPCSFHSLGVLRKSISILIILTPQVICWEDKRNTRAPIQKK